MIRICVLKVKESIIIEECRMEENAHDMEKEEEKLWNVLYVLGMAKEIIKMLQLNATELHGIFRFPVDMTLLPFLVRCVTILVYILLFNYLRGWIFFQEQKTCLYLFM